MRKLTYASVALVALIVTSVAVAHGIEGARSATAVAGTFSATAGTTTTRTCTTADGKTIVVTDGKYTGTAAGDPDLTGPITLRARSVVNTTDNVGVVNGRLSIDVAAGRSTDAVYSAVYGNGTIAGLAAGRAHQPHARLDREPLRRLRGRDRASRAASSAAARRVARPSKWAQSSCKSAPHDGRRRARRTARSRRSRRPRSPSQGSPARSRRTSRRTSTRSSRSATRREIKCALVELREHAHRHRWQALGGQLELARQEARPQVALRTTRRTVEGVPAGPLRRR